MIGSIMGGLIGQSGANQGGATAAAAAQQAATANQHQSVVNRSDASPWTSAGRSAVNQIGGLLGWGTLENPSRVGTTWEWNAANASGDQSAASAAYRNYLAATGTGAVPTGPTFDRLNVPTTFAADPGYNFRQAEGNKALERSAAARGKQLSGEQFKALSDFNSGLASQEYGNWWNRYAGGTAQNNSASQQEYANSMQGYNTTYGQTQDYWNKLMGLAGMGQNSNQSTSSLNSGLTGQSGNFLTSAGQFQGQMQSQGANALASGIGSGINNLMAGAYMGFGGANPLFGGRNSSYGANANASGLQINEGPRGPSGRY